MPYRIIYDFKGEIRRIRLKVCEIARKLGVHVTPETKFDEYLAEESKLLEILDAIEDEYGFCFYDWDLENVSTFHDIGSLIYDKDKAPRPKVLPMQGRIGGEGPKMAQDKYLAELAKKSKKGQRNLDKLLAGLAGNSAGNGKQKETS